MRHETVANGAREIKTLIFHHIDECSRLAAPCSSFATATLVPPALRVNLGLFARIHPLPQRSDKLTSRNRPHVAAGSQPELPLLPPGTGMASRDT